MQSIKDVIQRSRLASYIEERAAEEVTEIGGVRIAPEGIGVLNPAFDVTPAQLITAIITERGVLRAPDRAGVARMLSPDGKQDQLRAG